MKRFKFSLQTLHDLREQERANAEHALATAMAAVAEAAVQIEVVLEALQQAMYAYAVQLRTPDARRAEMHTEYLATLERRLAAARTQHAAHEHEQAAKLQEFVAASAAAEVMTKLRAQYYAQYASELAREEQHMLDELATIAAVRRSQGAP